MLDKIIVLVACCAGLALAINFSDCVDFEPKLTVLNVTIQGCGEMEERCTLTIGTNASLSIKLEDLPKLKSATLEAYAMIYTYKLKLDTTPEICKTIQCPRTTDFDGEIVTLIQVRELPPMEGFLKVRTTYYTETSSDSQTAFCIEIPVIFKQQKGS